ncbi:hypothetical protein SDC9_12963 [bioreactor metagenome]|uniref:Uncharacterized protein n=1 Tax=bioreactor metagenome TaxID=1076179 RepID=A0A644TLS1_9ZZZZ
MVEGGVDDARRHPRGQRRAQGGLARAARQPDPVAVLDAACLGVVGVDLQQVLGVPHDVFGAPGLGADVVVAEDPAGGQQQREARPGALVGRHIGGADEPPLAAHEALDMHDRRTLGRGIIARPLHRAAFVQHLVGDAGKARGGRGDLGHDLARVGIAPARAHGVRQELRHLPVGIARLRRHHPAHRVDPALGIGEGPVLFQEGRAGQEDMGVIRGLVQEEVVHDHAVHRREARRDVAGVGVGLQDILALDVNPPELPGHRGIEHVRDPQPGFGIERNAPGLLEDRPRGVVRDMAIARQLVREAAHVAAALHVVLPAQRVHPHALAADVAGHHREVGDGDDGGRALRMFGHAKAVIDRGIGRGGIGARRLADRRRGHAGQRLGRLGGIGGVGDEFDVIGPFIEIAALGDEGVIGQMLGHDHMRHRGQHSDIGARAQRQVPALAEMRGVEQVDPPRVDHDQLRPRPQPLAQPRAEDRVAVGRVRADDERQIGLLDRVEVLRAGRGAEGLLQPVAGGRVADPGAGVGVVGAEDRAGQLLH